MTLREWNSKEVMDFWAGRLADFLADFALLVEGRAKKELRKGHGVRTGTLRRSIHVAGPGYDWMRDDIEPSPSTPERGGRRIEAEKRGGRLIIYVGSGLRYAAAVEEGHGSFEGYQYLEMGLEKAREELGTLASRHGFKWKG